MQRLAQRATRYRALKQTCAHARGGWRCTTSALIAARSGRLAALRVGRLRHSESTHGGTSRRRVAPARSCKWSMRWALVRAGGADGSAADVGRRGRETKHCAQQQHRAAPSRARRTTARERLRVRAHAPSTAVVYSLRLNSDLRRGERLRSFLSMTWKGTTSTRATHNRGFRRRNFASVLKIR